MPAVWPASLPKQGIFDGYSEQPPDLTVRTQMDAGPAKVRRRFQAGVRKVSAVMIMTRAQVATLETFFYTTLAGGTASFEIEHPRTCAIVVMRFTAPPGEYMRHGASNFRVPLQMEILP